MRAALYREKLAAVQAYKLAVGCADCGYADHPEALEFDHLPGHPKRFAITSAIFSGFSFAAIFEEIEHTEVVCANCHRLRTKVRRRG